MHSQKNKLHYRLEIKQSGSCLYNDAWLAYMAIVFCEIKNPPHIIYTTP